MDSAATLQERLGEWLNQIIVIDCVSPYVAVGTLIRFGHDFVELQEADMHDLRDTSTSREVYVVKTARHGVQANRTALIFRLAEVVGVSLLADVIV